VLEGTGVGGAGGTYCGNPVACAAALAALDHYESKPTFEHANALGRILSDTLERWLNEYPIIGDHRGLGPMRAVELVTDRVAKTPNKEAVASVVKHAYENGVICISAGTYGNVLRFLIPLTATEEQLREGLAVVEEGIRKQCPVTSDISKS
jgi:4-aminobutyrate aminotransferase/(S)-3-amino-2-methylpropionate transaminase